MAAIGVAVSFWPSGAASTAPTGRMTIAVLPFANLSGDDDQEYLSDGFTEELISELGMIQPSRLSVIGRTTSILYKNAKKSIGEIGKELGVMYLLEGSVRRSGERVRVTAQLVDTTSMTNLWSESYDRGVGDRARGAGRRLAADRDLARAGVDARTRRGQCRRPGVVCRLRALHARPLFPRAGVRGRRAQGDRVLRAGARWPTRSTPRRMPASPTPIGSSPRQAGKWTSR